MTSKFALFRSDLREEFFHGGGTVIDLRGIYLPLIQDQKGLNYCNTKKSS